MNKFLKYALFGVIGGFLILQAFRGDYPEIRMDNPKDIHQSVEISAEVSGILKKACYDCHSMETKYPWYAQVAPISWRIIGHVEHGRGDLNFSEWSDLSKRKQLKVFDELIEEVEEGEMPLPSYVRYHSEAVLTEEEVRALIIWAKESSTALLY